jgi:hypothetical protein
VSIQRDFDGSTPLRPEPLTRLGGPREQHVIARRRRLGTGTLACPGCDAPVSPAGERLSPADPLRCPVCSHAASVRDFLSLAEPTRPARVAVYLVTPGSPAPALT